MVMLVVVMKTGDAGDGDTGSDDGGWWLPLCAEGTPAVSVQRVDKDGYSTCWQEICHERKQVVRNVVGHIPPRPTRTSNDKTIHTQ